MSSGFLYVLHNPSMPDLVKVGRTDRDPATRVKELSSPTGVPTPFLLVYQQEVSDSASAEAWVHKELESRGFRLNPNREFFTAPVSVVVQTVLAAQGVFGVDESRSTLAFDEESKRSDRAQELFDLGCEYEDGTSTTLKDVKKALVLYEQAARLKARDFSALAARGAGLIYMMGEDVPPNPAKALELFLLGVEAGDWRQLCLIASLFIQQNQPRGAEENYRLYFGKAATYVHSGDEEVARQGVIYTCSVVTGTINHKVSGPHLTFFGSAILKALEQSAQQSASVQKSISLRAIDFINSEMMKFPNLKNPARNIQSAAPITGPKPENKNTFKAGNYSFPAKYLD